MTAGTLDRVDQDELELWLAGDIDKPCEMGVDLFFACPYPANWVAHGRGTCGHSIPTLLVCDQCRLDALLGRSYCSLDCHTVIEVTWIERIREAR